MQEVDQVFLTVDMASSSWGVLKHLRPIPGFGPSLSIQSKYAPIVMTQQVCFKAKKHYDPKFRKQRREKFLKIDLPDYDEIKRDSKLPPDELRMKMKKDGKLPPRIFQDKTVNISSTGTVFEPYVPPEGDGKSSFISLPGVKERYTELEKKGKSFLQLRKVRQFEEDFDTKEFAIEALEIYTKAQKLLENVKLNEEHLHDLVSEKAYPEMVFGLEYKSLRWNFVESVEPPKVVHVRTTDMLSKENIYAQVTVRFHTKQMLSIYDRFGRLMYGSETVAKDILEYVVFEKHIADIYGQWRVHGKIIPDWMPPREPLLKTYREVVFEPIPDEKSEVTVSGEKDSKSSATAVSS